MALGAAAGLDLPLRKRKWVLSTGLRYMSTRADTTSVDPVILTLGFGRRLGG